MAAVADPWAELAAQPSALVAELALAAELAGPLWVGAGPLWGRGLGGGGAGFAAGGGGALGGGPFLSFFFFLFALLCLGQLDEAGALCSQGAQGRGYRSGNDQRGPETQTVADCHSGSLKVSSANGRLVGAAMPTPAREARLLQRHRRTLRRQRGAFRILSWHPDE